MKFGLYSALPAANQLSLNTNAKFLALWLPRPKPSRRRTQLPDWSSRSTAERVGSSVQILARTDVLPTKSHCQALSLNCLPHRRTTLPMPSGGSARQMHLPLKRWRLGTHRWCCS